MLRKVLTNQGSWVILNHREGGDKMIIDVHGKTIKAECVNCGYDENEGCILIKLYNNYVCTVCVQILQEAWMLQSKPSKEQVNEFV